ncbi:DNA-directed RNA polymerase subunit beta' [Patescibacteria group bacterium]|nr:DNA-directed RNA polymerase subunit beta' [Patescibacteria group bacterium]MCG2702461.1 DNA-directed RNA polymerase subunit beta' [Candidatus Parcubacteria bacterium]MBU4210299.1 DNA-directed RNA polymerase subunit beta' [Patescibacteria group bacterium]MBU4264489.1 DNA-directed RNA polymerase subunit beta' [Patescibacteria group bacterium]MBU4390420.1 DNA-directed RNA polymerase subunit beta' [Patescibacteria group bacterium]
MNKFKNISNFSGLKIQLASPKQILQWSSGEVTKPETINYRTWKPEKDGLFCEKIFGPSKDYECYCGKYKKIRFKGVICDKCGVQVTTSKVRRERMGHIDVATPVAHLWFLKNAPSPLSLILDVPQKDLEAVVYFTKYLVISIESGKRKEAINNLKDNSKKRCLDIDKQTKDTIEKQKDLSKKEKEKLSKKIKNKDQLTIAIEEIEIKLSQEIQKIKNKAKAEKDKTQNLVEFLEDKIKSISILSILTDDEVFYLSQFKADIFFKIAMGAGALLDILKNIDVSKTVKNLKKELSKTNSKMKKKKLMRKIRILNGMLKSQTDPSWMILTRIPIIPPDLRPMVQLTGGRFATSDLNDLYRRLINRNNRLKKLLRLGAPEIILRNEKRMLQESVDSLIDSQKTAKNKRRTYKRIPRSLSDLLRGKKGRFRRNLLGKRVDYSGRSVIVVGPELKLDEVGLPKKIALEMYRPFVIRELMALGLAPNIKSAKNLIDHEVNEVYDILELVTKKSYVLLNRAPTLHKLSIQSFKPKLIDGLAIRLHPCVCAGFNADFDGDQMGVHLPLSKKAIKEAKKLMLPSKNILKPSDGNPVLVPTQEMAVGCYYITSIRQQDMDKVGGEGIKDIPIFSDKNEAELAYQTQKINLRQLIAVRINNKIIKTSLGRIKFNDTLPKEFNFINTPVPGGKFIKDVLIKSLKIAGRKKTVKLIDALKDIGFFGFGLSGISLSVRDCGFLPKKDKLLSQAEEKIHEIENNFNLGLITSEEKKRLAQSVWMDVTEDIAQKTWATLSPDSPIKIVSAAGIKRASKDQIKQLSGIRGLMVDPTGRIVPLPTKSNFREGLSPFEYVTGTRGTRKGLADTALKTADAGYLTRRLVDASHACLVREEDCKTKDFLTISSDDKNRERFFLKRIIGRTLATDIIDPKTKKTLIKKGVLIDDELLSLIEEKQIRSVDVRSPIKCKSINSICQKCYGWDLSTRKMVDLGVPVGVIAAQSIGEPGTQLTLRTKHTGGVLGVDVTQGLPRVQELFEIRTPKLPSPLAEISGKVHIKEGTDAYEIRLVGKDDKNVKKTINYLLPLNVNLSVSDGDLVAKGLQFCSGSLDVREILAVKGIGAAQKYLIDNIQGVYESQGISVHDKHFEILVKEMSDKVKVENPGDSIFLYGQFITRSVYNSTNDELKKTRGKPVRGRKVLLGLIQSSLTTDSWLSAASFQQTTNILTEASLLGEVDNLIGLKENVIIGRLIPTKVIQ